MSQLSSYFLLFLFLTVPVADGLVIFGARCLPIIERSGNKSLCFHSYHIHVRRGKARNLCNFNIANFSWSLLVEGKSTTKTVLCYELRYFLRLFHLWDSAPRISAFPQKIGKTHKCCTHSPPKGTITPLTIWKFLASWKFPPFLFTNSSFPSHLGNYQLR